jgi:hypothetical protein
MNSQSDVSLRHLSWEALRQYLETKRQPVEDEIRRYPAPIAGCDAHFNYLLEQRTALSRELVRLDAASKVAVSEAERRKAFESFIRTSACIDAETAAGFRPAPKTSG